MQHFLKGQSVVKIRAEHYIVQACISSGYFIVGVTGQRQLPSEKIRYLVLAYLLKYLR